LELGGGDGISPGARTTVKVLKPTGASEGDGEGGPRGGGDAVVITHLEAAAFQDYGIISIAVG
jgi:hypothetical protein